MNELLFFIHTIVLVSSVLIALRMGKEALIAIFIVQILLANLFVTKQMICFGLNVTCCDVYTIGAVFSMNLLQVYFGKKCANQTLKTLFFLLFVFILMSQFQLRYLPSRGDVMHGAFAEILKVSPRIIFVSFISALLTQKLDIEWFAWLKKRLPKAPFFLPFIMTSLITQFLDTVIFTYGALYGIMHSMKDIIVMSYLIKIVAILSIAPFTPLIKKLIPNDPVQV